MTNFPPDKTEYEGGGAAAKKTYSPEELADVYKSRRADFLIIDLEESTLNWNLNYIYLFLKQINDLSMIDDVIEWMIGVWEEKNGLYDSFDNNIELAASHAMFIDNMKSVRNSVTEWIEKQTKKALLREKMLYGYTQETATIDPQDAIASKKNQTRIPEFNQAQQAQRSSEVKYQVKLEDLPEDVRKIVIVSQKVFDVYVKQLNEDLWLTVEKNKTKLGGCLFFLSNFYHITSRNTKPDVFAKLLNHVIEALKDKGSVESSIRRRSETLEKNIKRSYLCYANADANIKMKDEIWKLIQDCSHLLDGFKPVLDAIEDEKENMKRANSQGAQTSAAA